jgi:light-regulated signal transduction histidine kinase (bacteriophytochrome)
VQVAVQPDLRVRADARLLQVVVENLLGNAWKFTARSAEARIEVGGGEVGGTRAYWVKDNGAGFDMAYVHKLFQAFQRLHRVDEFTGTGIGLAIVARIVHRHGGRVWAEGAPGAGAGFFFTLAPPVPVCDQSHWAPPLTPPAGMQSS